MTETYLRQLVKHVDTVFMLQRLTPKAYLYISPGFERLTGRRPESLLADPEGLSELVYDRDRTLLTQFNARSWAGGGAQAEVRLERSDGEVRWVRLVSAPVLRAGGKPKRMVTSMEDVTDRVQAGIDVRNAEAAARAANDAKNVFLSRMSHELRTPLNAVLGFGQLLERRLEGTEDASSVAYILKAGRHLLDLINEVLDIARIESGEMSVSIEPVSVASMITETAQLVEPIAKEANVALHFESTMADIQLLVDRQRLRQILMNLLSNAIKYNYPGGNIWISADVNDEMGSISVRDDGRGVPSQLQHRLFSPFDRLGAETTAVEGTGVGLAVTRALVELMHGTIEFESQQGTGSTFTVSLPATTAASPATGTEDVQPLEVVAVEPDEPTATLLYVEDNDPNVRVIESLLRLRPRWRLLHAGLGSLGIELARAHRPDLVLLDLHLPDSFGLDVLGRLQADPATTEIPVVVLSADASPHQEQRLLAAGAFRYLMKPLDIRAVLGLLDGVASTLDPSRMIDV